MSDDKPAYRPPTAYLHGGPVPVVIMPARVAAWLEVRAGLNDLRVDHRGRDAEVDSVLVALRTSALAWRTSVTGSIQAAEPEKLPALLSTQQVADHLDLTDRAVRHAIKEGRLKAHRDGTRWKVTREDLAHYEAAKKAA
jgi:excisionase family DNA binding protein